MIFPEEAPCLSPQIRVVGRGKVFELWAIFFSFERKFWLYTHRAERCPGGMRLSKQ